jgi:hypothetical protein
LKPTNNNVVRMSKLSGFRKNIHRIRCDKILPIFVDTLKFFFKIREQQTVDNQIYMKVFREIRKYCIYRNETCFEQTLRIMKQTFYAKYTFSINPIFFRFLDKIIFILSSNIIFQHPVALKCHLCSFSSVYNATHFLF